jgi:hypothetical protein
LSDDRVLNLYNIFQFHLLKLFYNITFLNLAKRIQKDRSLEEINKEFLINDCLFMFIQIRLSINHIIITKWRDIHENSAKIIVKDLKDKHSFFVN